MQIVEIASAKKLNPTTGNEKSACMVYKFSTGNTMTHFNDGTETFTDKNGKPMNRKNGHRLVSFMRCLARPDALN